MVIVATHPGMLWRMVLLIWFLSLSSHLVNGKYIQISLYSDSSCSTIYYSVGVKPNTCIQHYDVSVKLTCSSSSGLVAYSYTTQDCSGSWTATTIITQQASSSCSTSGWISNDYLDFSAIQSYQLTCSVDDKWAIDNIYVTARSTSVLQKYTAIDYETESCHCDKKTVIYAYSYSCLYGLLSGNSRQYHFPTYDMQLIRYDYSVYYSGLCLGYQGFGLLDLGVCYSCSTFFDTTGYYEEDDFFDNDKRNISPSFPKFVMIIVILIGSIWILSTCYFFAQCLFTKEDLSASPYSKVLPPQPLPPPISNDTQAQYHRVQAAELELITVNIPPNAFPGQVIMVQKSNGMQVPFKIPPNIPPGGVLQAYF